MSLLDALNALGDPTRCDLNHYIAALVDVLKENESGAAGGGGASGEPIGSIIWYPSLTAPSADHVLIDPTTTIGSAASGATAVASDDAADLFALYWEIDGAGLYGVSLSIEDSAGNPDVRGADAATDFAAGKRLYMPDYRGRTFAALDDFGSGAAGVVGDAQADLILGTMGTETHTLTSADSPYHRHGARTRQGGVNWSTEYHQAQSGAISTRYTNYYGAGGAHPNMQPTVFMPIYTRWRA